MNDTADAPDRKLQRYRDYLEVLARIQIARHLQGKLDVSGVVQQTLLDAHRSNRPPASDDSGEMAAWLRRLLTTNMIDAMRRLSTQKRNAARERSLQAALDESSARLESWLALDQTSPSQRASRDEDLLRLTAALARLPPDQRTAVEMHHLQGCSVTEIAEQLGRSRSAAAGLLYRGLKRLRDLLNETER